ncbi:MAG TPA: DUF4139 domain-containing protein [Patescibacteria group bacterium]|nr:DUF4139 domain-containing protein [Patescibacteria group bacterium]
MKIIQSSMLGILSVGTLLAQQTPPTVPPQSQFPAQTPIQQPITEQPGITSTAAQSKGVSLTIYNQNFGVVREQREVVLKNGKNVLRFEDVAALIDPTSISFKSLTSPKDVAVREQNYQYDLLNPTAILNKSVGKRIRFRQPKAGGGIDILEGILLNPPDVAMERGGSYNQGLVIRLDNGQILLNPVGEVVLDELPDGLVSRPSLLWNIDSDRAGTHTAEVSYMTNGMTWKSDYVAVVNDDESKVDLTGWVTLDNRSGATYRDAQLQLMAGDVRRVQEEQDMGYPVADGVAVETRSAKAPQFQEESFFEYHLYTLDGKTTIQNNETKQQTLMTASNASVMRKLVFENGGHYYRPYGGNPNQNKVKVKLELKNSQENNMGMPLPKGKVRVYKKDVRGNMQFIGEDLIDHTSKDEEVRLYIGDAFDVVGERKQMDYRNISDRVNETTYEVTLRNHKNTATPVTIIEHAYGDWEVTKSSHKHTKTDGNTLEFVVDVPKDGTVKVTYTIRTRW